MNNLSEKKITMVDQNGEVLFYEGSIKALKQLIDEELNQVKNKENAKIHIDKRNRDLLFKQMQTETLGGFVMCIKSKIGILSELLNDGDLVRFIYISTYIKKEGYLILDNNKTYITKTKLKEMIKCSNKTFNDFYNKIVENKLLIEDGKLLKIDLDYFYRGNVKDYKKLTNNNLEDYTRLYINAIRNLYINNTKGLKGLSIAYKLLPYIHWRYNILCTNTNEIDRNRLDLLSVKDVMDILGYNKSKYSRFKKEFYNININEEGIKLFASVQKTQDCKDNIILINPKVCYAGFDIDEFTEVFNVFGMIFTNNVPKITSK